MRFNDIRWRDVRDTIRTILIIAYIILCVFTGAFSATAKGCTESYYETKEVDANTKVISTKTRECEAPMMIIKGLGAAIITPIYWIEYFAEKVHGN